MRKSKHHEYRQSDNAQAVVDAEGSQLVLGARVSRCASDANELVADIDSIAGELGQPDTVLADSGYAHQSEVEQLQARGMQMLVAIGAQARQRRYDFRPPKTSSAPTRALSEWAQVMGKKLDSEWGRATYRLRQQTVEPVFGIIKNVLGFTRFHLRGQAKVDGEWQLVCLAYNCKRLHRLMAG